MTTATTSKDPLEIVAAIQARIAEQKRAAWEAIKGEEPALASLILDLKVAGMEPALEKLAVNGMAFDLPRTGRGPKPKPVIKRPPKRRFPRKRRYARG